MATEEPVSIRKILEEVSEEVKGWPDWMKRLVVSDPNQKTCTKCHHVHERDDICYASTEIRHYDPWEAYNCFTEHVACSCTEKQHH